MSRLTTEMPPIVPTPPGSTTFCTFVTGTFDAVKASSITSDSGHLGLDVAHAGPEPREQARLVGAELLLELRERGEHQSSAVLLAAEVTLLQAVAVAREGQRLRAR